MIPVEFAESNTLFHPPPDLDESQCQIIQAFTGKISGGNLDGGKVVVVAWLPNGREIEDIKNGKPVFLTCIGGLPPHFLSTDFREASFNAK